MTQAKGILMRRRRNAGFTLIEVMITVAIVAILSMVALPSYRDYVRRTEATDATASLATGRARMEQYFQDNRNYGPTAGTACGPSVPTSKYFTYTCSTSNAGANFTLTATGTPGGAGSHVYTISDNGTRTTTSFKGAAQSGKNCWLIKGSEC